MLGPLSSMAKGLAASLFLKLPKRGYIVSVQESIQGSMIGKYYRVVL